MASASRPFSKLLIANRGEIAVRIIKTARRMGISTVVVHSDADAQSLAVQMADEAVRIGPAPAAQSYLLADAIVAAALRTGAEAIHPGFGFLSENAGFARRLEAEGLVFIGPNARAIEAMGDKITSKRFAAEAGVSTVPGHMGLIEDLDHAVAIAETIGFPVMIKASAGGGGKGIRVAWSAEEVLEGFGSVKAEARGAFGDDRIFIEKFITSPRHVEIQVLGDRHSHIVHLFERECSIQRRNQKVIEEAPSPLLDEETRATMGAQAVALARAVGYDSAGTVEFVAGQDRSFFFLEMNTRLQVEHPVTELITGVDLVEQMIRVAAGEPLPFAQADLKPRGWAIESRIYAEDPRRNFLPSIGRLVRYRPPSDGPQPDGSIVRNDGGVAEGDEISMFYDPMISKLCAWGETRGAAVDAMSNALDGFHIEGVGHNIPFLSAVMDQPRFREGRLATSYIAEEFPGGFKGLEPTPFQADLMTATAVYMQHLQSTRTAGGAGPIDREEWAVSIGPDSRRVRVLENRQGLLLELQDGRRLRLDQVDWRPGRALFRAALDGQAFVVSARPTLDGFDIRHRAAQTQVRVAAPKIAELYARLPERPEADTSRQLLSPMPGLVVSMEVIAGQEVKQGEVICIIEAMKMQNILKAERDGVIKLVGPKPGDSVAADEMLVEFA
jgi:propionyl-CoA carboxylase alpha chain